MSKVTPVYGTMNWFTLWAQEDIDLCLFNDYKGVQYFTLDNGLIRFREKGKVLER